MGSIISAGENFQAWIDSHKPKPTLNFHQAFWEQILFVRDTLPNVFAHNHHDYKYVIEHTTIVGEHVSKSVMLPVYRIELPNKIVLMLRGNFHDWKITVDAPKKLNVNFLQLFDDRKRISYVYCEGFRPEFVFDPYGENSRQFTCELSDMYMVFTFCWLLSHKP